MCSKSDVTLIQTKAKLLFPNVMLMRKVIIMVVTVAAIEAAASHGIVNFCSTVLDIDTLK